MAKKPDIAKLILDGREIQAAMADAVWEQYRLHKALGHPVAIARNGKVVWLQPHEIPDRPGDCKPKRPRRRKSGR